MFLNLTNWTFISSFSGVPEGRIVGLLRLCLHKILTCENKIKITFRTCFQLLYGDVK